MVAIAAEELEECPPTCSVIEIQFSLDIATIIGGLLYLIVNVFTNDYVQLFITTLAVVKSCWYGKFQMALLLFISFTVLKAMKHTEVNQVILRRELNEIKCAMKMMTPPTLHVEAEIIEPEFREEEFGLLDD